MNPVIPLGIVGLFAVCLHVFSGYAVEWLDKNPLKVAAFLAAVAGLFVFIRFAPGVFAAAKVAMCGCG